MQLDTYEYKRNEEKICNQNQETPKITNYLKMTNQYVFGKHYYNDHGQENRNLTEK